MEICSRCAGTGLNGHCPICGGAGFLSDSLDRGSGYAFVSGKSRRVIGSKSYIADRSVPAPFLPIPSVPLGRSPKPSVSNPNVGYDELSNPKATTPKAKKVRPTNKQERTEKPRVDLRMKREAMIRSQLGRTSRVLWFGSNGCRVFFADGTTALYHFERLGQPIKVNILPGRSTVGIHAPGKSGKGRVISNEERKSVRVVHAAKHMSPVKKDTDGGSNTRVKAIRPAKQQSDVSTTKTSIQIAFERVRDERKLDGSRNWSAFRDVGSGQFGSHPSFDSDDSDDESES